MEEKKLVEAAIEWLAKALPDTWTVEQSKTSYSGGNLIQPQTLADAGIDLIAENQVRATLLVEAKARFSPRDVEVVFRSQLPRLLRTMSFDVPILVVSDWLSPRTRELLEAERVNYLDLTGNALIRLASPTIFIRSSGATRAPTQAVKGQVGLRGPKAARVVRLLLDVRPPYGVQEIARGSGVAMSWVSRLLEALDREALVERSSRGRVESVDISGLLRRWAAAYDVFKANDARTFVAPPGAANVLERAKEPSSGARLAITGSFAAVRFAPVAAPSLLAVYVDEADRAARAFGLLPAAEGSNVVLLRPYGPVVWERTVASDGLTLAAPSQVAIDCLTGNGRMPQEGEALIEWMIANEPAWRAPSLASVGPSKA